VKSIQNNINYILEVTLNSFKKIILIFCLDTTPWFDAWRDCFLRISYSGDHEFLKNYLSCKLKYSQKKRIYFE
jgi:hypothetical protein